MAARGYTKDWRAPCFMGGRSVSSGGPENERLLGWIAAASAMLFTGTVVFVIIIQLLGPAFGIRVGPVSDVAIGTLVTAVVTLTTAVGVRAITKRIRNGNGSG